ncbi:MAG: hypothetical protein AB7F59_04690 [Bdellovibrionales bacterium]
MFSQFKKILLRFTQGEKTQSEVSLETPRAPRIKPTVIHNVHFHTENKPLGIAGIFNISVTGIGLLNVGLPEGMDIGSAFHGHLNIAGKSFTVHLRVAHINGQIIGCAFEGDSHDVSKAIYDYFVAEISAMEVTEVNASLLKKDSRGDPRWFFGANNSEVYITETDGRISYFHVTLLGNYFESYADGEPKFGYIVGNDSNNNLKPDQAALIQYTNQMPQETLNLIGAFVRSMTALPQEHKAFILSVLSEALD